MNNRTSNAGSALILALSVTFLFVALGTAGLVFSRHERIQAAEFLTVNNITHAVNIGVEKGISLAHLYANPRRSLCLINDDNPSSSTCNATTEQTTVINGQSIDYQLDFQDYNYPSNATFIIRAPYPGYDHETTVTLDTNLNVQRSVQRSVTSVH